MSDPTNTWTEASSIGPNTTESNSVWNLQLKFAHIFVFWSVIAGTVVSSFLLGLFSGRQQGVESALSQQDDSGLRFPLASLKQPASSDSRGSLGSVALKSLRLGNDGGDVGTSYTAAQIKAGSQEVVSVTGEIDAPIEEEGVLKPGWYVQILAANTRREAENLIAKLSDSGMKAVIQMASLKKLQYYRVLAGPYQSRATAVKKRSNINGLNISPSDPFIRKVS